MKTYTAQDRTGPMIIKNSAITIAASGKLPFFWGNRHSIAKGYLVSNDENVFYQLSAYELFLLRKASGNSSRIITAPFNRERCDDWFIRRDKNLLIITDNFSISNDTARKFLHFGGVMDSKGNFCFKSISNAKLAIKSITRSEKVKHVMHKKHSLTGVLIPELVEGRSILIVNPSDFVSSEICALTRSNMVDFVETSSFFSKQLVKEGGVFKSNSIYGLELKNRYEFILFAGDSNEVSELFTRSLKHLRIDGKMLFIAPADYRSNAASFYSRIISLTSEFSKKDNENEITLINRKLISCIEYFELLRIA
jgi:hypothetical protein